VAILTFTGLLAYAVVKNFHHCKKKPSVPAAPAGVIMVTLPPATAETRESV
jgi:hypothetical protein